MRWPLRYQIMLPVAAILLLTVVAVGGVGAYLAVQDTKARIDAQVREVARIIEEANFPLTPAVLRQMKALSGADLIAVDVTDHPVASSGPMDDVAGLPSSGAAGDTQSIASSERVRRRGDSYFHAVVALPAEHFGQASRVHILFSEQEYRQAWQRAVYPSLWFIALALPVVMLLSFATGSRIASRVAQLRSQVDRIAEGEFEQFAIPVQDDELRSLAESVNRLAAMLASYEQDVRRTERMRTLAHLSGGIAHQLRNSATGCAMAVDLHAQECPLGTSSETLSVAKRQLRLMEEYVQRFLRVGKSDDAAPSRAVDLAALVDDVLPLVQPAARHAGVTLCRNPNVDTFTIAGDADQLGQVVVNLLLNAVEAASRAAEAASSAANVEIDLSRPGPEVVMLTVSDTGPGPAAPVEKCVFDPFVTDKADGVGLGLSVTRQIVAEHGGRVSWRRAEGRTFFTAEFPCQSISRANEDKGSVVASG